MIRVLLLALLACLLLGGRAEAGCPPLPYVFVPGTTADANQVNANFNAVTACAGTGAITVANLTALRAACTSTLGCPAGHLVFLNGVIRLTDGVAGAPPLYFSVGSGACATDDGASCVDSSNGNSWKGIFPGNVFNVAQFGAVGDSSTDVSQQVAYAMAACKAAGGGEVFFNPTGHSYTIAHANLITTQNGNGCGWYANAGHFWPGTFNDNVEADWTAHGAWIKCTDATNECAQLTADGQSVVGLNFWQTQPTPSSTICSVTPCKYGSGFTPTAMPAVIAATGGAGDWKITDNQIVNAYACLDIEGPSSGVGNFFARIEHNALGCLNSGEFLSKIDNNIIYNDNHDFLRWFQQSIDVLGWKEQNYTGMTFNYVANPYITNSDWTWAGTAWFFEDGTITNGFGTLTFAAANMQVANVQFNEVCQAVAVQNGTTHLAGGSAGNAIGSNGWDDIYATVDSQTSGTPSGGSPQCAAATGFQSLFNLASDNVAVLINTLQVGFANTVATVGNGASGYLAVGMLRGQEYAVYTSNLPAFKANAEGMLSLPNGLFGISPATGAGPYVANSGILVPFDVPSQLSVTSASGVNGQLIFCTLPSAGNLGVNFGCPPQWGIRHDTSGDLDLDWYNSSGTFQQTPININQSTGQINIGGTSEVTHFNSSAGAIVVGGNAGVTCAPGAPTSSFATANGLVIHC